MRILYLLLPCLIAAAVILWDRLRLRRIMAHMDRMLDRAISGEFPDGPIDESQLSRLEAKLAHYLSASSTSMRNVSDEKNKIKTLIADISHQTKTPIANVLLYAQLLSEQELTPEGRACASALEEQAQKLQTLIDALVKTSRLETGVFVMHPVPGPLAPTLEEAVAQFAPIASEKGVSLTLTPTDAAAVFDAKWTGEAVCNLLDNAIKYTPSGGSVTVEAAAYEMFSRVSVIDTGPGIPEAEHAGVFRRFYRAAAFHQQPGVGIGLYLTRQIAERQGGFVKLYSRPGRGATFSLYLPRS